jgi:hypothetical protein
MNIRREWADGQPRIQLFMCPRITIRFERVAKRILITIRFERVAKRILINRSWTKPGAGIRSYSLCMEIESSSVAQ